MDKFVKSIGVKLLDTETLMLHLVCLLLKHDDLNSIALEQIRMLKNISTDIHSRAETTCTHFSQFQNTTTAANPPLAIT